MARRRQQTEADLSLTRGARTKKTARLLEEDVQGDELLTNLGSEAGARDPEAPRLLLKQADGLLKVLLREGRVALGRDRDERPDRPAKEGERRRRLKSCVGDVGVQQVEGERVIALRETGRVRGGHQAGVSCRHEESG